MKNIDVVNQILGPIALGAAIVNNALVIANEKPSKVSAAFAMIVFGALVIATVVRLIRLQKILRRAKRNTPKDNDDERKVPELIIEPATIANCIKCGRDATNVRITSEAMEFYCRECNDKENESNNDTTEG